MTSSMNGTKMIAKNGGTVGEVVGLALGIALFSLSVYAFSLSIRVNKLSLRKLKDEGYE